MSTSLWYLFSLTMGDHYLVRAFSSVHVTQAILVFILREIICQKICADQFSTDHWGRIRHTSVLKNQELSFTQSLYFTTLFWIQLNRDYESLSPVIDPYIRWLNLLILNCLWFVSKYISNVYCCIGELLLFAHFLRLIIFIE